MAIDPLTKGHENDAARSLPTVSTWRPHRSIVDVVAHAAAELTQVRRGDSLGSMAVSESVRQRCVQDKLYLVSHHTFIRGHLDSSTRHI
jgi:hypothetical protein